MNSEDQYRHPFMKCFVYTDGVRAMAEENKAFWLIDLIVSHQLKRAVAIEEFQHWTLKVDGRKGFAFSTDGGKGDCPPRTLSRQSIPYTDFPKERIDLYVEKSKPDGINWRFTLMLPEER